jgi:hypothetical protein
MRKKRDVTARDMEGNQRRGESAIFHEPLPGTREVNLSIQRLRKDEQLIAKEFLPTETR